MHRPLGNRRLLRTPTSARRGQTLVEVIVAVVVLSVGVLGLAATAAVVLRQMTASSHQRLAAEIAASRLERIRAASCVAMRDSSAPAAGVTTGHVTEHWQVVAAPRSRVLFVYDTVRFDVRGELRTHFYHSAVPCAAI